MPYSRLALGPQKRAENITDWPFWEFPPVWWKEQNRRWTIMLNHSSIILNYLRDDLWLSDFQSCKSRYPRLFGWTYAIHLFWKCKALVFGRDQFVGYTVYIRCIINCSTIFIAVINKRFDSVFLPIAVTLHCAGLRVRRIIIIIYQWCNELHLVGACMIYYRL